MCVCMYASRMNYDDELMIGTEYMKEEELRSINGETIKRIKDGRREG